MRAICALFILLVASPAWAGKILVLESEGMAGFAAGQTFDGAIEINVPAGARLVLMDERGIAVTVKGPYKGVPGGGAHAAGPSFLDRVSAILTAPSTSQPVLGATRSPFGPAPALPDVWALDVTRDGPACVRAEGQTMLWRPTPRPTTNVTLTPGTNAPAHDRLPWPAAQATLAWPAELPLEDGLPYSIMLADANATRAMVIRKAGMGLPSEVATLDWLAGVGCTSQAKVLLTVMAQRRVVEGPLARLFE
jgi:hypothetical protein